MAKPTVSVIIPCYNSARFLGETIGCVLAQGYPSLEIIAVDDGSTDNTAAIVARYPGVRLIRQGNAGVAVARNNGLRQSTGEYIIFLDHDDRLAPGALESNLKRLLEQPDCAFSFGDVEFINSLGAPLSEAECAASHLPRRLSSPYNGKEHYLPLLRSYYIPTPGMVLFRRTALEAVSGFDTSIGPASDVDLVYRLARRYHVCYSGVTALEKRVHDRNQMDNDFVKCIESMMKLFRRQQRWIRREPSHMAALQHNLRWFEDYWARSLIEKMVANIRGGSNWRQTGIYMLAFLRYTPIWPARYFYRRCRYLLAAHLEGSRPHTECGVAVRLRRLQRGPWMFGNLRPMPRGAPESRTGHSAKRAATESRTSGDAEVMA
jgi:glycosyltransferase involved in cell wall biosynthesis